MSLYVIDASVAVKWFVPEIHAAAALKFLHPQHHLLAPDLLLPEFGNILWKKVCRNELTKAEAGEIIEAFTFVPVTFCGAEALLVAAFELASSLDQTVYDCLYLALAIASDGQMVTADRRFYDVITQSPFASHLVWIEDEASS